MTHQEYLRWREFQRLYPMDDLHRIHRPAALVAGSLAGGDIQRRLDWLQPPKDEAIEGGWSVADMNTFKAFGMKPPRKDH